MTSLLLTVLMGYFLVCAAAFLLQRRLIYLPGGPPSSTPDAAGLAYEEVALEAADGTRLAAWWIPAREPFAGVLVAHGNAGSIEHRLHIARAYHELELGVLLFDYRGYGASEGRPHEEGLYLDAEAAHAELSRRLAAGGLDAGRLVAHGESLGGAVVVELARRRPVGALVIESAWTSLPELGARVYPFLPVRLLLRERFSSLDKLAEVDAPMIVLHGPRDEIVPFAHGERLARAAGAELVELAGRHNDGGFGLQPRAAGRVGEFLREVLGEPREADAR